MRCILFQRQNGFVQGALLGLFLFHFLFLWSGCSTVSKPSGESNISKEEVSATSEVEGLNSSPTPDDGMDSDEAGMGDASDDAPMPGENPLERLVWQALMANPDVGMAEARVMKSEASLASANSRFLPALGLDTGYIRADAPSVFLFKSIDARSYAPGTNFNDPGVIDNFESGMTARYNLINGGRDVLQRDLARLDRTIAERSLEETRNAMVAQVGLSYFEILRTREALEVARRSAKTLESSVNEKSRQFAAGAVLESEVLSLKARLAEAKALELRAENASRSAMTALRQVLGKSASEVSADEEFLKELSLSGAAEDSTVQLSLGLPPNLSLATGEAFLMRPELEKARMQVEASGLRVSDARRAYLPRLDGVGRIYWDDAGMRYEQDNWWVGLTLSWDLFDGGQREAGRKMAQALAEEMRNADRKLSLAVESDVERSFYQLQEAEAQQEVAEQGLQHAEKVYAMVEVSYRSGAVTVTRFLEVEQALLRARLQRVMARYDLKQAEISMLRAIGRWTDPAQWPDWRYWTVRDHSMTLNLETTAE